MKRILDKALDSYDRRQEKKEELFEKALTRNVEALSTKRAVKTNLAVLGGINLVIWACVIIFPHDLLWAFEKVGAVNGKLVAVVIAIVFGIGLWLTYCLCRLKFPNLEDRSEESGMMASFAEQENATRRIRVWILSVVGAVLNLLALAIIFGLRVS